MGDTQTAGLTDDGKKWIKGFTGKDPDKPKAAVVPATVAAPVAGAGAKLNADYEAAVAAKDWPKAAEILNGFSAGDIKARLSKRSAAEVASLHDGAAGNPKVGPRSQVAQMTGSPGGGAGTAAKPGAEEAKAATATGDGTAALPASAPIQKDFDVEVPDLLKLKKKYKVWGGRIEIEVAPMLKVSGTAALDKADKTSLDMAAISRASAHPVLLWHQKQAEPAISGNVFSNMKVGREGATVAVKSSSATPMGTFSLELVLVGVGGKPQADGSAKADVKILSCKAELAPAEVILPDSEVEGIKFTKLKVKTGGTVEIAPAWRTVILKWAVEEAAKDAGKSAASDVGEAAVAVAGADIVIAGALIVGGVLTVVGAIYSIVQAWGIGDLAQEYGPDVRSMQAGFKAGMEGGKAPSDRFGRAGFEAGARNFQALFDQTKKARPQAADDQIKKAIAAKAGEALGQIAGELDTAVRQGLWDGYLAQHTTLLVGGDAKWGFLACWGHFPKENDPEWGKYIKAHPTQSNL